MKTRVGARCQAVDRHRCAFDGQEDPGTMQAACDFCPTGNEADLASTILTAVGIGNPLRQYGVPYDDGTKDYFGPDGRIGEDYSGTPTQAPAFANGDCQSGAALAEGGLRQVGSPGIIPAQMPVAGGGGMALAPFCSNNEVVSRTATAVLSELVAGGAIIQLLTEPNPGAGIVALGSSGQFIQSVFGLRQCFVRDNG